MAATEGLVGIWGRWDQATGTIQFDQEDSEWSMAEAQRQAVTLWLQLRSRR